MVETAAMAKDRTFNLRLDDEDRARLEVVAHHLSAPAATAVRMLVKERYDRLVDEGRAMPIAVVEGRAYQLRAKVGPNGRQRYDILQDGAIAAYVDMLPSGMRKTHVTMSANGDRLDRIVERFVTLGFIK